MLARAGMSACLEDVRSEAGQLFDLEGWVREKPWWLLGASAGAGFLAGRAIFSEHGDEDDEASGSRKRAKGGGKGIGALIGPLVAPMLGAAVAPLLRGFGREPEAPSPLEKLAFGRFWNGMFDRFV